MKTTWTAIRTCEHRPGTHDPRRPTAMFDFDSTLRPFRGRGPSEELTLRFLGKLMPDFNVVIVTNRGSTCAKKASEGTMSVREYVEALDEVSPPESRVTVYAATAHDRFRKPHTGAWDHYIATYCGGARPGFAFFCGDAAGRAATRGTKADHSSDDYNFALNIGVTFVTVESLFGWSLCAGAGPSAGAGAGDPWADPASLGCRPSGPPSAVRASCRGPRPEAALLDCVQFNRLADTATCVVMVGSPASGKSRIAKLLAADGFRLASRDLQGNRFESVLADAVARGEDVVVDNTSPRREDRERCFSRVSKPEYRTVICHVTTPKEVCFHLNAARCQADASGATAEVPDIAINIYWKRLEAPAADECDALIAVPFALADDAPAEVTKFRY